MIDMKATAIYITLPFWLRWAKRFVKLDVRRIESSFKGKTIEYVIIDEACNFDDRPNWLYDKAIDANVK